MGAACKPGRQMLDNPRECHQLSRWSSGWRTCWTLWGNLRSGAHSCERVGKKRGVHETDKLWLWAEVRVAAQHGGGGVCEPSLAIRAVGRKVRLGAGEEGQHSLEDDSDLCVHHHSHNHTLLRETQLCFTPFFWTSQTFSLCQFWLWRM